jgi:hypothetical protein
MIRSADLLAFAKVGTPNTGRPQNGLTPSLEQRIAEIEGR